MVQAPQALDELRVQELEVAFSGGKGGRGREASMSAGSWRLAGGLCSQELKGEKREGGFVLACWNASLNVGSFGFALFAGLW